MTASCAAISERQGEGGSKLPYLHYNKQRQRGVLQQVYVTQRATVDRRRRGAVQSSRYFLHCIEVGDMHRMESVLVEISAVLSWWTGEQLTMLSATKWGEAIFATHDEECSSPAD